MRLRLSALFALLPLAGCPLGSVEGEIPEVCMSFHDRLVEGMQPGRAYERTLTSDPLDSLRRFVDLDAEITDARATLQVKSGVTDLSFLESVSVIMRSAEQPGIAPVSLVDCADFACASPDTASTLADEPPADVMDVIRAGRFAIDVTMGGALPENDWVIDLEVCVSGKARVEVSL